MMSNNDTIVEAVFRALLQHFWQARRESWPRELDLYPHGYLISYGQIVERSGVPIDLRHAGGPLFHVAAHCEKKGWPPLNSLVVRSNEGYPGDGFFSAPGSTVASEDFVERMRVWADCAEACISFEGYPGTAPRVTAPY